MYPINMVSRNKYEYEEQDNESFFSVIFKYILFSSGPIVLEENVMVQTKEK